jgi:hypothetical protein
VLVVPAAFDERAAFRQVLICRLRNKSVAWTLICDRVDRLERPYRPSAVTIKNQRGTITPIPIEPAIALSDSQQREFVGRVWKERGAEKVKIDIQEATANESAIR